MCIYILRYTCAHTHTQAPFLTLPANIKSDINTNLYLENDTMPQAVMKGLITKIKRPHFKSQLLK